MGFLDNSGDIIFDTVLTEIARERLAKGDGSFKISKFSLSDDEIDYSLYNRNHASGSAYYDLDILQTPVFESFTKVKSSPKSFLITIARNDLLYLPIMKVNQQLGDSKVHTKGIFIVAVNEETENLIYGAGAGIIKGENGGGSFIRVDQGLDTKEISYSNGLSSIDPDLVENLYHIQIDHRFGRIVSQNFDKDANLSYVNVNNIATYNLSLNVDSEFVTENTNTTEASGTTQVISGPRGTLLKFTVRSSQHLNTGDFYFDELGTTEVASNYKAGAVGNVKFIDSTIRIIGGATRFTLDVPVRFVKKV